MPPKPAYDLALVQDLVRRGAVRIGLAASAEARRVLGFDDEDICDCLLTLTADDFHKSIPASSESPDVADVYRPLRDSTRLYVKLTVRSAIAGRTVVVISFHLK